MTLHQQHDKAENALIKLLKDFSFICDDLTYHKNMDKEIQSILSKINTPTPLYIRTRPDRIAISPKFNNLTFQFEVKTHDNLRYKDCLIELFPLIIHKSNKQLFDIDCFYFYKNPLTDQKFAFSVDKIPAIREINIPPKWKKMGMYDYFHNLATTHFPSVPKISKTTNGTDDPYLLISNSEMEKLLPWETFIYSVISGLQL